MASLQMLLTSYLETIGNEITVVGKQVAGYIDPVAVAVARFQISKETSLKLLTAVSLKRKFPSSTKMGKILNKFYGFV